MTSLGPVTRRTALAGGLGVAAIAALSACTAEPNGSGSPSSSDSPAPVADAALLPTYAEPAGLPKPDIEGIAGRVSHAYLDYPADPSVTVAQAPGDGTAVRAAYGIYGAAPPAPGSNPYWQEINNALNADLQIETTPIADYNQKFAVMVAGNDLPDLVVAPLSFKGFPQLLKSKFADLGPHLSGDAAADYPNLAAFGDSVWRSCVYNDTIYSVPQPSEPLPQVMYARRDIFADMGIQDPTSLIEFGDIAVEFTNDGASKWAVDSLVGLTNIVMQAYGLPQQWAESGGKFTHRIETEEYKHAVAALADLVGRGILHPDAVSATTAQAQAWFANGTCLFHSNGYGIWSPAGFAGDAELAGKADPINPFGVDESAGTLPLARTYYRQTLVTAADPERVAMLLRILDWLSAPFGSAEYTMKMYGTEGEQHTLNGNEPALTEQGVIQTSLNLASLGRPSAVNYNPGAAEITKKRQQWALDIQPQVVEDPCNGLYSATDRETGGQILVNINDMQQQVVLGRAKIEELDSLIGTWRSEGGDKIRSEYEAAFAAQN